MKNLTIACLALVGLLVLIQPASAAEITRTYDFAIDTWFAIEASDGPVDLQRIRLDRKEGRWTKSTVNRPHNQEYLETVGLQLEYTNNASRKWRARISARWLDEDGAVIDGFSMNETLEKRSASKIEEATLSTLKYGLEKAVKLEVTIRFEP